MNTHLSIDYPAIGQRLRAYRIGASLKAEELAHYLGISRAAVYRLEKGEIVKIEVLDRLSRLLNISISNLLGVEVEYYPTASGFFERMRQLEQQSSRILAHFEPFSFLLTSPDYIGHLQQMLSESSPDRSHSVQKDSVHNSIHNSIHNNKEAESQKQLLSILSDRKKYLTANKPEVLNLISIHQIEKLLYLGLIGSLNISPSLKMERALLARKEVIYLIESLEQADNTTQVAIVDETLPNLTFEILYNKQHKPFSLAVSPFRLGEFPNINTGIASVTSSPDALHLHQQLFEKLWDKGAKGSQAIDLLKKTIARF